METVLRPHRNNLVRWAANRPEVLVLSGDLTASCEADGFRDAYPERFFSMGMAEQNMMGFAAGLAREGYSPWVHTFAVFVTRRPYDQVAMSIAYPNLPVRLVGLLPGLTTPGGVTHQAIDDLALMGALPNMTVLACGDASEVESVLDAAQAVDGPVYIRMLRKAVPRLFPAGEAMEIGRLRALAGGEDLLLVSCGICTEQALRAAAALRARGLSVGHLHAHTLKPFDDPALLDAAASARHGIISVENHSVIGGLGSAIAARLAEAGLGRRLVRLGVQDTWANGASQPWLLRRYGLDAAAIFRAAAQLVGQDLRANPGELDSQDPAAAPAAAAAEGL